MKYILRELPIIEIRKCARCGMDFGITARQRRKKYCDECKIAHQKEYHIDYYSKPDNKAKANNYVREHYQKKRRKVECERCHQFFTMGRGKATICINCLINSDNIHERERGYLRRNYDLEQ